MSKYLCVGGPMDGKFVKINDNKPPYTIIVSDPVSWNTITQTERIELMSEPVPTHQYELIQMSWPTTLSTDVRWIYMHRGTY